MRCNDWVWSGLERSQNRRLLPFCYPTISSGVYSRADRSVNLGRGILLHAGEGHRQLNELGVRKPLKAGHVDFP